MEYVYRKADESDVEAIYTLVQDTIKTVYPDYYPQGITDFFCRLHGREAIAKDIRSGYVSLLTADGRLVGTGSCMENHITRVYVSPVFQGKGYGGMMMQKLESEIAEKYDSVNLDASLPASRFYENRGYRTVKHEKRETAPHAILVYEVMEKELTAGKC